MSTQGKIKTLYSDKEKTEKLYPRTKIGAISDNDGVGLEAILDNMVYSSDVAVESVQASLPVDADTLGGHTPDYYATKADLAGLGSETQIVQADWSQNDETAADYVKNRTHYEEMLLKGEFYNGTPSYVLSSRYDDLPYFYKLPDIETDQLYSLKQFSLKVSHSLYGEGEKEVLANTRYKTTWGPTRTFMITVSSADTGPRNILSIAIYCSVSSSENIIMSDLVMANTIPEKYIPPTFVRTDVTSNLQSQIDNITPAQIGAATVDELNAVNNRKLTFQFTGTGANTMSFQVHGHGGNATSTGARQMMTIQAWTQSGYVSNLQIGFNASDGEPMGDCFETLGYGQYVTDIKYLTTDNVTTYTITFTTAKMYANAIIIIPVLEGVWLSNCADITEGETLNVYNYAVEDVTYNPGCYYRMVNGEKEWLNPPMVLCVEYRTTERWNGKPVYTMLFDFGDMPAKSTTKEVVFSDDETISRVIRCSATSNADVTHTYPAYSEGTILFFGTERRSVICDNHTNWGMQYFSAQVQVWYVKN